jgi:hypothetical protein
MALRSVFYSWFELFVIFITQVEQNNNYYSKNHDF